VELFTRLHSSELKINMALWGRGGQGSFENVCLVVIKCCYIVAKFAILVDLAVCNFWNTDFLHMSPKHFVTLNFLLPLQPMGPRISNYHKPSGIDVID